MHFKRLDWKVMKERETMKTKKKFLINTKKITNEQFMINSIASNLTAYIHIYIIKMY